MLYYVIAIKPMFFLLLQVQCKYTEPISLDHDMQWVKEINFKFFFPPWAERAGKRDFADKFIHASTANHYTSNGSSSLRATAQK
jgi:hypothetical protein